MSSTGPGAPKTSMTTSTGSVQIYMGSTGPTGPVGMTRGLTGPTGPIGVTGIAGFTPREYQFPSSEENREVGYIPVYDMRVFARAYATMSRNDSSPVMINPYVLFFVEEANGHATVAFSAMSQQVFSASPATSVRCSQAVNAALARMFPDQEPPSVSDESVAKLWGLARLAALRNYVVAAASLVVSDVGPDEAARLWREAEIRSVINA